MPLVSSVVLPHGPMVFDGGAGCTPADTERLQKLPETLRDDCQTLFRGTCEAVDMARATKPDVIFLNTSHGICSSDIFCVYINSKAKGNAEWNDQWTEYEVNVELDSYLAKTFVEHLKKDNIAAEGILLAFTEYELPLCWGEVVPLWFLRDLTANGVKVVIFSDPLKRKLPFHLPEVAEVGQSISKFFNGLKQRVLYVVSGDLAHSHQTDCTIPLYSPDPRFNMPTSDQALPFDLCIEHWVRGTPYSPDNIPGPKKTKVKHSVTWDGTASKNAERWLSKAIA